MIQSPLFRKNNILHFTRRSRSGVWRKIGEASVRFPKSVMIWGAVTSAGVGLLCFIKHKVNAAVYREILEHFMLSSAEKLYGDADFLFQQEFSTLPSGLLTMILLCLISQQTCLTWPPSGIHGIFSRERWDTVDSNNPDELKAQYCPSSATCWSLPCHTSPMLELVLKEPEQVLSA